MTENKVEQYCKLPIPITAYQTDKEMDIETLEGTHHANVGDWIITGVKGEQYPCKPDVFAKTYIKYGQANKMQQVAAMFGKKLGEEFEIVTPSGRIRKVKFTADRGSLYYDRIENEWCKNYALLEWMLRGKAVIIDD